MKRLRLHMGLAVGLGWTLVAAGVSAQEPNLLPGGANAMVPQSVKPIVHEYSSHSVTVPVLSPPAVEPERPRPIYNFMVKPVCDCWRSHGYGCWNRMEHPGCTSCSAQWTFMFGSCRQFFGEPCLTGPAPQPGLPGGNGSCGCRP
jgi:hypothetical protein